MEELVESAATDAYIWVDCACCGKNVGLFESEIGDEDVICGDCDDEIVDDE
jgi:DNA-directed RNA polymerase subunit RPC12/RpoP